MKIHHKRNFDSPETIRNNNSSSKISMHHPKRTSLIKYMIQWMNALICFLFAVIIFIKVVETNLRSAEAKLLRKKKPKKRENKMMGPRYTIVNEIGNGLLVFAFNWKVSNFHSTLSSRRCIFLGRDDIFCFLSSSQSS